MVAFMALSATASRGIMEATASHIAIPVGADSIRDLTPRATTAQDSARRARRESRRLRRPRPSATNDSIKPQKPSSDSISSPILQAPVTASDSIDMASLNRHRISGDTAVAAKPTGRRISRVKTDLDNVVDIVAKDSMVLIGQSKAYIYGEGEVTYGSIKLDADRIEMDMAESTVYAVGTTDSIGDVQGSPVFNDKGTEYKSETMRYNFKTEKGFITNVITEQGEGFLTGGTSKKIDENTFYLQDGFYTTCGGIKVNEKTQVLDEEGQVIGGLYAGGSDAGGLYGDSYDVKFAPGSQAAWAVNSGRLAMKDAKEYLGK